MGPEKARRGDAFTNKRRFSRGGGGGWEDFASCEIYHGHVRRRYYKTKHFL